MIKGKVTVKRTGNIVHTTTPWTKAKIKDFLESGIMGMTDFIEVKKTVSHPWDSSRDREHSQQVTVEQALAWGLV